MTSLTYRRPAALKKKVSETRVDPKGPPAQGFFHDGKLNLGPALLLAGSLSAGFWLILFSVGAKLFH